jgi:HAD superfamily hydrolase (TIGR01549 family)
MNIKGIIFDFGFTLFEFKNPSIEKYFECFKRGLKKSFDLLKESKIIEDDSIFNKFTKIFTKTRMNSFTQSIKTKIEITTSEVFQIALDLIVKKNLIQDFGELKQELLNELAELYHFYELDEWIPFKQTKDTLKNLANIKDLKLAVLSNHPHHSTVVKILKNQVLAGYFDTIVTSAGFGKRKPDPDIFRYTLKKMGLKEKDSDNCLMCGDEYADIVGGHRLGFQLIQCERVYKFPFEKEFDVPDVIKVKNISEILDLL